MTLYLLMLLMISPSGELKRMEHVGTFGSLEHCGSQADKLNKAMTQESLWVWCVETTRTKGLML